jgi:hypothetical protein
MKLKTSTRQQKWSLNNRDHPEWEKVFSGYTSEKGLIIRIYRELKKLNTSQINEPIKKYATELNRTFSKEDVQTAKKNALKMLTIPG